jgi:hypothetical protein
LAKEVVIRIPPRTKTGKIVPVIERAIVDLGLIVSLRGSLKSFPGCKHWHLQRGGYCGTLEITWWPRKNYGIISMQTNVVPKNFVK